MPRVYMSIDDANVVKPKATLHVCNVECMLSEQELDGLLIQVMWAKDAIRKSRDNSYTKLAEQYKDVVYSPAKLGTSVEVTG